MNTGQTAIKPNNVTGSLTRAGRPPVTLEFTRDGETMKQILRPVTDAEERFLIVRVGMDALTTGQAGPRGIADLDRALWLTLERTDARELDRI